VTTDDELRAGMTDRQVATVAGLLSLVGDAATKDAS
jgi:hypothetical protein